MTACLQNLIQTIHANISYYKYSCIFLQCTFFIQLSQKLFFKTFVDVEEKEKVYLTNIQALRSIAVWTKVLEDKFLSGQKAHETKGLQDKRSTGNKSYKTKTLRDKRSIRQKIYRTKYIQDKRPTRQKFIGQKAYKTKDLQVKRPTRQKLYKT